MFPTLPLLMSEMADVESFHRGKGRHERPTKLNKRQELPSRSITQNPQHKPSVSSCREEKCDCNVVFGKGDTCFIRSLELWYMATDEPRETRNVEYGFSVKSYVQIIQSRGINPGHKSLCIFVGPFEVQPSESGDGSSCWRRRMTNFAIWARSMEFKLKGKQLEAG